MGLKTLYVYQKASGRMVTINAKDFDEELYALEAPQKSRSVPPPPPQEAAPAAVAEPKSDVDSMLDSLNEGTEAEGIPRRRRTR